MPRLADHEQRRKQITDATRRVIARDGLSAATFQSVAAEAGISVRLVQYYFGTKREFLIATHQAVLADAGARLAAGLTALGAEAAPREILRTTFAELLPLDDTRRDEVLILGAFQAARLGRAEVENTIGNGPARYMVNAAAQQLARLRRGTDARMETITLDAELLVAAVGGLAQGMLGGFATPEHAELLLDRLLDRLLPP
ncbi:TetR/AcrR family transcriptional regulator [Nocardia sp. NPDC050697]|uniref:TetR/AcrR family transcriptional regulator n=1 Tax=Nocardia sp. NPDC050697 TaxID=3155158 RepID=UPI0033FAE197